MAFWLLKTEPGTFSWDDQVKKGAKGEPWSGVRNHQAKLNLMKMRQGERAFFYHSGEGREIVGIVEVIREHYPDPTDPSGKFVCVDVKAVAPLEKPVTLAAAKAEKRLAKMILVNNTRLSVQPVSADEWKAVCAMGRVKG
jgi:predicted RNA-binding protein with PUA-like domain